MKEGTKNALITGGTVFAAICFFGYAIKQATEESQQQKVRDKTEDEVRWATKELVIKQLKNPNVAEFENLVVLPVEGKKDEWTVGGIVRSTNSFGGIVPTQFIMSVKFNREKEQWENEHLELFEDGWMERGQP